MPSSKQRLPGEYTFTIILAMASAFLLWTAWGISGFESLSSAGAFPMGAAALMAATALFNIVQVRRRPSGEPSTRMPFIRELTPAVLIALIIAMAVYVLTMPYLGFLIASTVFLLVGMRLLGNRRIGLALLVALSAMAIIHLVFQTVFSVVLPTAMGLPEWFR